MHAIRAHCAADLLWLVVVGPGVEHVELAAASDQRRGLDAVLFPIQLRRENRVVGELGPPGARKVGIQRSGSNSEKLCFIRRVAAGEIE